MRGWYTFEAKHGSQDQRVEWHEMSHGESFVEVLRQRMEKVGFYVLDEPEAALSFSACLGLVGLMKLLTDEGSQVLCATHSPILTALPDARILELDEDGIHAVEWDEARSCATGVAISTLPSATCATCSPTERAQLVDGARRAISQYATAHTASAARRPSPAPVMTRNRNPRPSLPASCAR